SIALSLTAHPFPRTVDQGGVNLVVECESRRVGADFGARPAAILVDALDIVARLAAEVERFVRAFADAPEARREDDLIRPRKVPADHPRMSSRAASSS